MFQLLLLMEEIICLKGICLLIVMLSVTGCGKIDNGSSRQEVLGPAETVEETLANIDHDEIQTNNTLSPTPASWSLNTMIDTTFADIVYADDKRVIFYAYFGLFEYDLTEKKLTNSLDLKAINCQKVQCGGRSEIYADTQGKRFGLDLITVIYGMYFNCRRIR